jgi:hypothetical protein
LYLSNTEIILNLEVNEIEIKMLTSLASVTETTREDQSEKFYPIAQIDGFLSPKRGEPESDRIFNKEEANEPE